MTSAPENSGPASLHVLFQRAVEFHQRGEWERARAAYEEVIEQQPRHSDALHLLGVIAAQTNNPARAVELIRRAIDIDPTNYVAHGNLGAALHGLGQLDAALASYDRAIGLKANFAQAHLLRGNLLYELKCLDAALTSYDSAIAFNPGLAEAYSNRGNVLCEQKQITSALASYDAAIALKPNFAEAHSNRGNVLRGLDRFDAALASYDRAIAADPACVSAYFNRGVALNQLKRPAAALLDFERAVAIEPNFAEARFNRSLVQLLMGDFANGWREHEWRWKNRFGSNIHERRDFGAPLWLGEESLDGASILLYGEQGFGDTLQLCRYARRVADLGADVILEVPKPLEGLLADLEGVSQLVSQGSPLPPFDYHCPLMSLPLAFKTDLGTIPAPGRYLRADASKIERWRERLGRSTAPRIGLMWNGNPIQPNDRNRSFRLANWISFLPSGFQYVSLQRDVQKADMRTLEEHSHIVNWGDELRDFSDTAALCDCMDLVISVCTSVAHLSGALGKPTWVLLAHAADWRWLLDRSDSPWYPSAVLYRQPSRGDWPAVFRRVQRDLLEGFPMNSSG